MKPYDPPPLPPTSLALEGIIALIGRANAVLSRYDGLLESLVNPDVMLSPLIMKEAELSSRIEGTIATANEAFRQQAGQNFEPEKAADIGEILNYRHTLRLGSEAIQEGQITLHLIRQMHARLMRGVRGESKNPGRFRETQNWIGPRGCPIEEATFVPPDPLRMQDSLEALSEFMAMEDPQLDPLVQASMIHAQFEIIHPFDDGNGRIGRLLVPLFLCRRGSLVKPSLYLSGYLEANRDEYYARLSSISSEGNWLGWITFFLTAVVEQASNNLLLVREIADLYEETKYELTELLHSDQAIHILDVLFDTPVFAATEIHQRLGIQRQRAAQYIRSLKEAGLLREIREASGRRPAILSFEPLWKITDRQ